MTVPKYDPMAYTLGCNARTRNESLDTCPYPPDFRLAESWDAGWRDVNKAIREKAKAQGQLRRQKPEPG